jgi:V8-like Glu-specific endopeptidase
MNMATVFDFPYPWHERQAQQLHVTLTQLYPTGQAALMVAQKTGIDTGLIYAQQAPIFVWREVLDQAAVSGLTRDLVVVVCDLLPPKSPSRPFIEALLAGTAALTDSDLRSQDGTPLFIKDNDDVSEPEALLYHDDLTIQIGRVPGLIATLQRLVALAPSVCRLTVDINGLGMYGTGFRIDNDMLLTNWHVLHDRNNGARATAVTAEFGYEDDGHGGALAPMTIPCDVTSIVTSQQDDWAVIRVTQPLSNQWPVVKLSKAIAPTLGTAAYIIQHPGGDRKRVGFVRNQVSFFDDRVVQYLTDTQEGSSGSPVFDTEGRLIALHHVGGRPQEILGKPPVKKNEGIRISRVISGLSSQSITIL